jgi:hypothetical protein
LPLLCVLCVLGDSIERCPVSLDELRAGGSLLLIVLSGFLATNAVPFK